jgi:predicted metal-dependent peptidase
MAEQLLGWGEYCQYLDFVNSHYLSESMVSDAVAGGDIEKQIRTVKIKVNYAAQKIAAKYKFFAEIIYGLDIIYTYSIPTAATDGSRIFISPAFFAPMTDAEILFVLCHEVMHVVLLHHSRMRGRDPERWNVAGDYEINLLLVNDNILTLDDVVNKLHGLIKKEYKGKNAEQLYDDPNMEMPQDPTPKDDGDGQGPKGPPGPGQPGQPGQGKPGQGQPGQGSGEGEGEGEGGDGDGPENDEMGDGKPKPGGGGAGKPGGEEKAPTAVIRGPKTGQVMTKEEGDALARSEGITDSPTAKTDEQIKDKVRAAAQKHLEKRSTNKGSGNNGEIYQRIMELTEPIVNWRMELNKFIGKLASSSEYKMPNRRYVSSGEYRYGLQDQNNALENAVLALDVSGSIASAFPELAAEVAGIIKAKKIKTVSVLPFADSVVTPFQIKGFRKPTADDFAQVRTGGGSEAIPKVIEWVDTKLRGNIDFMVIMTDGYLTHGVGTPPRKWGKRVIWLVFDNPKFEVEPAWGKVIHANGDKGYWFKETKTS